MDWVLLFILLAVLLALSLGKKMLIFFQTCISKYKGVKCPDSWDLL